MIEVRKMYEIMTLIGIVKYMGTTGNSRSYTKEQWYITKRGFRKQR